MVVSVCGW